MMMAQQRGGKYFTCYFCNKKVDDDTELGHTSMCGNVLLPCPNKCGSYVPRMEMQKHKIECLNRVGKTSTRLSSSSEFLESYESSPKLDRKQNGTSVKALFTRVQEDIKQLSSKLSTMEQRTLLPPPPTPSTSSVHKQDLDKLKYQNFLLIEWRRVVDLEMEKLKEILRANEKSRKDTEAHWMNFQQKMMEFEKLQMDVEVFKNSFFKEQNYSRQVDLEFAQQFDQFKEIFDHENAVIGSLWGEHKDFIEDLRKDVEEIRSGLEEFRLKQSSAVFELKTVQQIASEASQKIEIQEREMGKIRGELDQIKLDLEILEELASSESGGSSTSGHLMFKITEFASKLAKAKESNTVVKTQAFYSHDFGYRIKVLFYLNGLKKWKDRYCLISIQVLKGEYDQLMPWPCHIEGSVSLRDLEDFENPKNFSKYIAAKRLSGDEEEEEPQESSSSYIFIPHATLTKSRYLKDDVVFFEIKIEGNNRKSPNETQL